MFSETYTRVIGVLEQRRVEIQHRVANALMQELPGVGILPQETNPDERHQENMNLTAARFHDLVLAGATVDWTLVSADFAWLARKMPATWGVTFAHHQKLITLYFTQVQHIHAWTAEEQEVLEEIATHLREAAEEGYTNPSSIG